MPKTLTISKTEPETETIQQACEPPCQVGLVNWPTQTENQFIGDLIPDYTFPITATKARGRTLTLTSTNQSDGPAPRAAQEAAHQLNADLTFYNGPSANKAIPSTGIKRDKNSICDLRKDAAPHIERETLFLSALTN